jgi:hypothetical protein
VPPKWRGVRVVSGGDLQLSNLSLTVDQNGEPSMSQPHVKLRTDMWPFWLEDAIDAAKMACEIADLIPDLMARYDAIEAEEEKQRVDHEIDRVLIGELRATMRAITASAFAIDAFTQRSRNGAARTLTTLCGATKEHLERSELQRLCGSTCVSSQTS